MVGFEQNRTFAILYSCICFHKRSNGCLPSIFCSLFQRSAGGIDSPVCSVLLLEG